MKKSAVLIILAVLLASCAAEATKAPTVAVPPTATSGPSPTSRPTNTPRPSETPKPTATLAPTVTPRGTSTPTPRPTGVAVAPLPTMTDQVAALVRTLVEGDDQARTAAVQQLAALGPQAAAAIPAMIRALSSGNTDVRQAVAQALPALGPQAEMAIPALMQALADPNADVRQAAVQTLGAFGPQAMQAVPVLIQALQGGSQQVQASAAQALQAITGQDFGLDAARWQEWWQALQAGAQSGSGGPLDFPTPGGLDAWEAVEGGYRATIIVHISGGAAPFSVYHDTEMALTAEREYPLVFIASGCTLVHTIKVESSDGQSVSHSYYIGSPWCS